MDFLKPYGVVPSKRQMEHYKIEKKAFFHFGVNTFTNLEWGEGTESESAFNPVGCDCRQWIRAIKEAGFELAIITAKHHDGFCLWPSEYTEHSVKNSPYKDGKGDIIKEFTDACHEYGVKVGIYISPWDRNSEYWGSTEYSKFFQKQLTELLTDYGHIDEVWWDGAGSQETPYDWGLWAYTIRNLQPDAAIFGSLGATPYVELRWVGNEGGFAGNPCFGTVDAEVLEVENTALLNSGVADGNKFAIAEVDTSIRPGWFFHEEQEDEVKSVSQLVHLWFDSVGSNANMLLNFPPDRTGKIREKDISRAIEAHKIISKARSCNLCLGAKVTSDTEYFEGYNPENILNSYDESFFAPEERNAVLTVTLPKTQKFNMFEIAEVIEKGHRIRGFRVEAKQEDDWKVLFDGKCIGYKWAEYFDEVETDTVRIVIYDAKDIPLIRSFALYSLDTSVFEEENKLKSGVDIAKRPGARVIYSEHDAEVEFGGIYPFNTITFNGTGMWGYSIDAFDGAKYYTVFKNSKPHRNQIVTLPETIKNSYKIRIHSDRPLTSKDLDIGVFEL